MHQGNEWLYVLDGRLRLVLGDEEFTIEAGEAVEFTTWTPHWFGAIDGPVELIANLRRPRRAGAPARRAGDAPGRRQAERVLPGRARLAGPATRSAGSGESAGQLVEEVELLVDTRLHAGGDDRVALLATTCMSCSSSVRPPSSAVNVTVVTAGSPSCGHGPS